MRSERHLRKREVRWAEFLAKFHFTVHHIAGKVTTADPLGRQHTAQPQTNSLEISLELDLKKTYLISDGYEDDPDLSDNIRRLTTTRQDTLHDKYLWSESTRRLYFSDDV